MANTALIIIDVQNDYFPGGKMELVGSPEASARAAELLAAFRARGLPIAHIQHIATKPTAAFFLPGTSGAEIHESVRPATGEKVFVKHFPNSFRDTGLDDWLRGQSITKLVVAGMMSHMCVDTTVRAAFDLGYDIQVAYDATATKLLTFNGKAVAANEVQASFLAALTGTFARVIPTSELISPK